MFHYLVQLTRCLVNQGGGFPFFISPQVKRTLQIIRDTVSSIAGKIKPPTNKDLGVHRWKNCIYGVNYKGLAGETKAVHFQSESVVVVQVLFLTLSQGTCVPVEKSSCHGNGAPSHH